GTKEIKKVAIVGGGGSSSWRKAQKEGYDIFLSGDIPHHVRRDIILAKYNYLDLPHEIEKVFMPTMKDLLLKIDSTFDILIIDHEKQMKPI
ncbi:MAG: Nif3-like dinuclear metal center hexameric protein, partial [Bacilli bacterium]|nr:Nif3-like dinuclear metal center hexameric protein [Bacilli bacterium]